MTDTSRRRLAQAFLWLAGGFDGGASAAAAWHHAWDSAALYLGAAGVWLTTAWVVGRVEALFDAKLAKAQADRNLSVAAWEVMQRQLANGQSQIVSLDVPVPRSAKWKN